MNPAPVDPSVSVVLCAHNPRPAHLQSTLDSLRQQDLLLADWELIVIDKLSKEPLAGRFDVSWHPRGRIVVESNLGLAHARRRGYQESRGRLIIHSDDDNILAPDYLSNAWRIQGEFPHLGNFGGQVEARFEQEPRNAVERSFGFARSLDADRWSNQIDDNRTMPYGAGMCLRRAVVDAYLAQVAADPRRLILGRTGNRFITGEDIDLNYVAVRSGFGTGLFKALRLVHLIGADRMQAAHGIRYGAGNAYSMVILQFLHFGEIRVPRRSLPGTLMFWLRVWLRMSPYDRRMELAMHRARLDAVRDLHAWGWVK
jgi:glycosyltransferase involved in cell wall biosynthesis